MRIMLNDEKYLRKLLLKIKQQLNCATTLTILEDEVDIWWLNHAKILGLVKDHIDHLMVTTWSLTKAGNEFLECVKPIEIDDMVSFLNKPNSDISISNKAVELGLIQYDGAWILTDLGKDFLEEVCQGTK